MLGPSLSSPLRMPRRIAMHFTDVVHHAVQQPLRVHFAFAAQAEAAQSARAADVAEHGFDNREPPAVLVATVLGVDLALHLRAVRFGQAERTSGEEHHLPYRRSLGMA